MLLLPSVLVTISSIFLYLIVRYYYNYLWAKTRLKTIPNVQQYPILGSAHKFSDAHGIYKNMFLEYPKIFGKSFWLMVGFQPVLITADLDLVEIVLSSQKHIDKPETVLRLIRNVAKNGLLGAPEHIWKRNRKTLAPTFHYKVLEQFLAVFNKHADKLVEDLAPQLQNDSTELVSVAKLWSLNQARETVLGLEADANNENNLQYLDDVEKVATIICERLTNPIKYFNLTYCFTKTFWLERSATRKINSCAMSAIKKKKEVISRRTPSGGRESKNVCSLDLILQAVNADKWTTTDVMFELNTLLFGAYETVALTLAYTLYNFAEHRDMQQRAFEEVSEILEMDAKKDITMDALNQMKYLEMFLKETMRVYTVAGFLPRKLGEDVSWSGLTLPKDLSVVIPMQVVHHDPETYPDPQKTIPERFTSKNSKGRHPYAYIPFSAGPRNCIGLKYAMLALKTCLAKMLLSYRFVSVNHKMDMTLHLVITSKNGVKVGLQRRE